jgi:hypothetical protein
MKLRIMGCVLFAAVSVNVFSQGGTKSPYSQFGIGILSDESQGMSRGMNGVGIALRQGNQVNTLNPASYAATDSLTMIFDAGLFGQKSNFKEGGVRKNCSTGGFDYFTGQFRLFKGVGMSFGVLPYSNVGYSYESNSAVQGTKRTLVESSTGTGGLHQAYVGIGVKLLKPLSVGANIGYLWGDLKRSVTTDGGVVMNTLSKSYTASVKNYKLDVGVQWEQPIGREDRLTFGATMGIGHRLNADPEMSIVNKNVVSGHSDTTRFVISDGLELPMSYGVGVSYNHANKLIFALDAILQKWGDVNFPAYDTQANTYSMRSGILTDRTKVNVGCQWTPNPFSNRFFKRVNYRLGAGYATPYYKINNNDGPKEVSVSCGFGIPIFNGYYANRPITSSSVLNISAQWVRSSAPGFITDNSFRLNIGLTFNERWFAKWKVE